MSFPKRVMLKLTAMFLVLFGVVFAAALILPQTAAHLNPKGLLWTIVLMLIASGVGLLRMKRWGLCVFLLSVLIGFLYNYVSFGVVVMGSAWVGLSIIGAVTALNWKELA